MCKPMNPVHAKLIIFKACKLHCKDQTHLLLRVLYTANHSSENICNFLIRASTRWHAKACGYICFIVAVGHFSKSTKQKFVMGAKSQVTCCAAEGFIRLYRLVDNGRKLELVHKTAVGGIPGALAVFKGRLLVGVGPIVRLYDLGKKKLLRKSEYRR